MREARVMDARRTRRVVHAMTCDIVLVIDACDIDSSLHRHGASCYRLVVRSFAYSSTIVRVRLRDVHASDLAGRTVTRARARRTLEFASRVDTDRTW